MPNSGWGLDPWGLGFFGGLLGPLELTSALATATRVVRVTTTVPPLALSVSGTGDALNPATWSVSRNDNGFAFTVAGVALVDSMTFDITVVEAFGPASVLHTVSSLTLRKATGELVQAPRFEFFAGIVASDVADPQAALAKRKLVPQDIANPPAAPGLTSVGGTLVMTPGGDYANVTGAELVKKLVIRRLTTKPGEFAHLPNYGVGAIGVKDPVTTASLILLRREAERQILLEPEVAQVAVIITLDASSGILTILAQGRLKPTGESFSQSFQLPSTGVL